jgi:CBS domain-containing protein
MTIRSVRDAMAAHAAIQMPGSASVAEAARRMKAQRGGAVLVVDGSRLLGIFTERDAVFRVLAEGRDAATTTIAEVMTRNPQTIGPTRPFGEALQMMLEYHFRHVPVVEDGRPVGLVTVRDALAPEVDEMRRELAQRDRTA